MRLRQSKDGYDYICTHLDDFKIVARDPKRWMDLIETKFALKSVGPPSYYLGNDYNWSPEEKAWVIGCQTYVKEAVHRIEDNDQLGGALYPHKVPLLADCHPELDDSPLLDKLCGSDIPAPIQSSQNKLRIELVNFLIKSLCNTL